MRVVVLIDQQNLYRSARDAYRWTHEPALKGNASPIHLSRLLATGELAIPTSTGEDVSRRELSAVRVYMGTPSVRHEPYEQARALRQQQEWEHAAPGIVRVLTRSLKYPPAWARGSAERPREKGIDVMIAMDLVRGALQKDGDLAYDLVILVSGDTDLLPAVEFVIDHHGAAVIQTAAPLNVAAKGGQARGDGPVPIRASAADGREPNRTILIPEGKFRRVEDRVDHYQRRSQVAPLVPLGRRRRPPKGPDHIAGDD